MECFKGVMLSTWNSISGPKIEHLWLSKSHPLCCNPDEARAYFKGFDVSRKCVTPLSFIIEKASESHDCKVVKPSARNEPGSCTNIINAYAFDVQKCLKMSGKLLIAEIESKKPYSENTSKLYCLGNDIVLSVVFHKQPWLSEKSDAELQNSALAIMLNCDIQLTFDVHRIIDLHLRKAASLMQRCLASPASAVAEVSAIIEELCQVIFSLHKKPLLSLKPSQAPMFQQFQTRMKFLSRAIASHLQTCGYSVVTGDSRFLVNQLAQILLLFNSEQERLCSEANMQIVKRQYSSGLHVQALPRGKEDAFLPDAVFRDYPISIIDIDWQKIRQTLPDLNAECNSSNLLKTVADSGSLIPQLLEDLIFLEENDTDVRSIVESFFRFLNIKAVALIKVCQKYRSEGHSLTEKKMLNLLNIGRTSDLRNIMGCAEKLQPGISLSLL